MAQQQQRSLDEDFVPLDDVFEPVEQKSTGFLDSVYRVLRQPASTTADQIADWLDPPNVEYRDPRAAFGAGVIRSLIPDTHAEAAATFMAPPLFKPAARVIGRIPGVARVGQLLNRDIRSLGRSVPAVVDDVPVAQDLPLQRSPITEIANAAPEPTVLPFLSEAQINEQLIKLGYNPTRLNRTAKQAVIHSKRFRESFGDVEFNTPKVTEPNAANPAPSVAAVKSLDQEFIPAEANMASSSPANVVDDLVPPNQLPTIPPSSGIPPSNIPAHIQDAKKASIESEIWNLSRGLLTAGDLTSAAFRQARPMMLRSEWWKAWNNAVRSFGNERTYKATRDALFADPLMQPSIPILGKNGKPIIDKATGLPKMKSVVEDSGLYIPDLIDLTKREESIAATTLAERVPLGVGKVVRASNRAYTSFLSELRLGAFKGMLKDAERSGLINESNFSAMSKDFARLVNDLTGRGSLEVTLPRALGGKTYSAERYGTLANTWLFSPRLAAAQARNFNRWFNPFTYYKENPIVRKEKLKGLLSAAGFWTTLATLGHTTGLGEVNLDPTNSDFGKIRIGPLRLEIGAGLGPWIVAGSRLITQQSTSSETGKTTEFGKGFNAPTAGSIMGNFAYNKLHPSARFVADLLTASDYQGTGKYGSVDLFNPNPMKNFVIDSLFMPMVIQDLYEIAEEDPTLLPLLAPGVITGAIGTQRYGRGIQ